MNPQIQQLQSRILAMQGYRKPAAHEPGALGLGFIERAFPLGIFPRGAVHEFISYAADEAAATDGFISTVLTKLLHDEGICFWVGIGRTIYPPALKQFGIAPERVIFIELQRESDVLWTIEEVLKCDVVTAVVGELRNLDFAQSRRLQLAAGKSRVTGFIHRCNPRRENTVTCVSRWKIKPIPSVHEDELPGPGMPRWNIALEKVRNGKPGIWQVEWNDRELHYITRKSVPLSPPEKAISYA